MRFPNFVASLLIFYHSISLNYFVNATLYTDSKIGDILSFLAINGKRHLSVVSLDNYDINVTEFQYKILEISKRHKNLYSKRVMISDKSKDAVMIIVGQLDYYQDSLVIIASSKDAFHWDTYFELLTRVETMSATLIFPELIPSKQKILFLSKLEKSAKSRFFYWIYENDDQAEELSYNRVITLVTINQVVVNKLNFNEFGLVKEDYDLQGMHILSTTVSWPPYISLNQECKSKKLYNNKCRPYGHLVDALNAMAKMSNFTWECHADVNDNYGTTPLSGPANASGSWGGVVGDVFYGRYHFSMSTWVWKEERQDMFDFSIIVADQTALAITLKAKEIDYTLFTRPFRMEAWLLIGFAVILFFIATIVPYLFAPNFGSSASYRLIQFVAFGFFMLTEIYYSGALTMFFSTAPTLPFETMEEVMREYPAWKLMMRKGNDVYFVYKVQDGDPDYVAFWNLVTNEPHKAVFVTVGEGMEKVLSGFYVAQMQEGSIKGWIRDNPIQGEKVKIFGRGRSSFYTLILTNNSPLGRVFSSATRELIERGVIDRINSNWLERKKSSAIADLESTLIILKPGQMILVYFLIFLMGFITLIVFLVEHIWKVSGGDQIRIRIENRMLESEYLNMG